MLKRYIEIEKSILANLRKYFRANYLKTIFSCSVRQFATALIDTATTIFYDTVKEDKKVSNELYSYLMRKFVSFGEILNMKKSQK